MRREKHKTHCTEKHKSWTRSGVSSTHQCVSVMLCGQMWWWWWGGRQAEQVGWTVVVVPGGEVGV